MTSTAPASRLHNLKQSGLVKRLETKSHPANLPTGTDLTDEANPEILQEALQRLRELRGAEGVPYAYLGKGGRREGNYELLLLPRAQHLAGKPPYWQPRTEEFLEERIEGIRGGRYVISKEGRIVDLAERAHPSSSI